MVPVGHFVLLLMVVHPTQKRSANAHSTAQPTINRSRRFI